MQRANKASKANEAVQGIEISNLESSEPYFFVVVVRVHFPLLSRRVISHQVIQQDCLTNGDLHENIWMLCGTSHTCSA